MDNKDLRKDFIEAAKPLMDFIRDHYHPHVSAIITMTTAELVEGLIGYNDDNNVND